MTEEFTRCTNSSCIQGMVVTDHASGEVLCGKCGLVLYEKFEDNGPEFRFYDLEGFVNKTRTGAGTSLAMHDMGLTTMISNIDKDALGNSLPAQVKFTFNRLRTWDARSKLRFNDKKLKPAFTILRNLTAKLVIGQMVTERSAHIYRKVVNRGLTRGRNIPGMVGAALYVACREAGIPRTLSDISEAANIPKKDISRCYNMLAIELNLNLKPYDSFEFIGRISSQIGLGEKTRRQAFELLSKITEKGVSAGRNPVGLAASIIYLSCIITGERKNQEEIANTSGISAITIRNTIKCLRKEFKINENDVCHKNILSTLNLLIGSILR